MLPPPDYPLPRRIRVSQIVKACCLDRVEFINLMRNGQATTDAMIRGIGMHGLILSGELPPEIVELQYSDYRTKQARDDRDEAFGRGYFPVRKGEPDKWARAIDPSLCAYFAGYEVEKPLFGTLQGFGKIQGRLDACIARAHVKDVKTTTSEFFKDVNARIYRLGYDIQLYLYMLLNGAETGEIILVDIDSGCWLPVFMEREKIEDSCQARLARGVENFKAWEAYRDKGMMRLEAVDYQPPTWALQYYELEQEDYTDGTSSNDTHTAAEAC